MVCRPHIGFFAAKEPKNLAFDVATPKKKSESDGLDPEKMSESTIAVTIPIW